MLEKTTKTLKLRDRSRWMLMTVGMTRCLRQNSKKTTLNWSKKWKILLKCQKMLQSLLHSLPLANCSNKLVRCIAKDLNFAKFASISTQMTSLAQKIRCLNFCRPPLRKTLKTTWICSLPKSASWWPSSTSITLWWSTLATRSIRFRAPTRSLVISSRELREIETKTPCFSLKICKKFTIVKGRLGWWIWPKRAKCSRARHEEDNSKVSTRSRVLTRWRVGVTAEEEQIAFAEVATNIRISAATTLNMVAVCNRLKNVISSRKTRWSPAKTTKNCFWIFLLRSLKNPKISFLSTFSACIPIGSCRRNLKKQPKIAKEIQRCNWKLVIKNGEGLPLSNNFQTMRKTGIIMERSREIVFKEWDLLLRKMAPKLRHDNQISKLFLATGFELKHLFKAKRWGIDHQNTFKLKYILQNT